MLRAEIQRAAAAVPNRTLCLSSGLGMGLTYNSKSSWDQRQYEPWPLQWELHLLCSFPLWNSNIRNLPRKWSNTMGLSYFSFISLISPPDWPQGHSRFNKSIWRSFSWKAMLMGRSQLSTVCIKLKLPFQLVICSILRLWIHSSARKKVEEDYLFRKKKANIPM